MKNKQQNRFSFSVSSY